MNEVDRLFAVSKMDFNEIALNIFENMVSNIKGKFSEIPDAPDIPDSFWDKYRNNLDVDGLRMMLKNIYQRHLTPDEISGIIKFWESPIGQKSKQAEPIINEKIQQIGNAYFEALASEVIKEMIEENE